MFKQFYHKSMIIVKLREDEPAIKLTKRFKKKVDNAKVLKEYKSRRYYIKPNVKKKIAKGKLKCRLRYAKVNE